LSLLGSSIIGVQGGGSFWDNEQIWGVILNPAEDDEESCDVSITRHCAKVWLTIARLVAKKPPALNMTLV
jgi:hypothetical protein